jgi:hypothetical protein
LGSKSYGEVAFNYDEDSGSGKLVEKGEGEPAEEEVIGGDEPFTVPPELDIPINMALVWTTFGVQEYTAVCVEIRNINAVVLNLALHLERIPLMVKLTKTKLHGLSPRANYSDQATADCRRS